MTININFFFILKKHMKNVVSDFQTHKIIILKTYEFYTTR